MAKRGRPRDPNVAIRAARAIELRTAGMTYEQIAVECGYDSKATAHNEIWRHVRSRLDVAVEDMREVEGMRLDALLFAMWPDATHKPEPIEPGDDAETKKRKRRGASTFAQHAVYENIKQRRALFGLDQQPSSAGNAGQILIREYGVDVSQV
jgi:hypothetical protein